MVINNTSGSAITAKVKLGGKMIQPAIPAHSFNTFNMGGTENTSNWVVTNVVYDPYNKIEAESYSTQSGIQTESCGEGGQDVGFINNGDWTSYKGIDFKLGATKFETNGVISDLYLVFKGGSGNLFNVDSFKFE